MTQDKIFNIYKKIFGGKPTMSSAPGRINLIGEHTDYNDGFVLPGAINKRIYFALGFHNSNQCNIYSANLDEHCCFSVDQKQPVNKQWANYFLGVIQEAKKIKHFDLKGFNCVFGGDLPIGAGLSSSAALETGFAILLNETQSIGLNDDEIIHLSQKAEHNFVGLQCGIMDQFSAMKGKKDKVLKLDCRSLDYEYYPLQLKEYELVIVDSKVKHSLAFSEYNLRKEQCKKGVEILKNYQPGLKHLRDVSHELLNKNKGEMEELIYKRCRYVLDENQRVHQFANMLKEKNSYALGKILYEGHQGLSEQYGVSCPEIDFLIEETRKKSQILGSRMMGGGFGGCTINLIEKNYAEEFEKNIKTAYKNKYGIKPDFYEVTLDDGAKIL